MSNIISTILIIASLGVFFGYINPAYGALTGAQELSLRSVKELKEERPRYLDAMNKTREVEEARKGLLAKYNAIPTEDRERIEKLLPDHVDSVRLIIDINNVASQYRMTLKNISLVNDEGKQSKASSAIGPREKRFKEVELSFNITGSYENFRAFVRDLEQSLRLVDVETVTFAAAEEAYDYSVTILTYTLSDEAPPPASFEAGPIMNVGGAPRPF